MKTILLSQKEKKFEWDYLKRVNQREVQENAFMEGQKECAQHSTKIIADLMTRISMLELEIKK